jgi:hypothetical protein
VQEAREQPLKEDVHVEQKAGHPNRLTRGVERQPQHLVEQPDDRQRRTIACGQPGQASLRPVNVASIQPCLPFDTAEHPREPIQTAAQVAILAHPRRGIEART